MRSRATPASLTSWADLSRWTYELNAGRAELPPALVAGMQALVQGETDERARIRKVYKFLQANTRYISVQLGLGGWQTFPASSVAANGYGDCKALTNYCQALLGAAGIKAHAALVRAGSDEQDIRTDFPSSQFNHVVLCVPLTQAGPGRYRVAGMHQPDQPLRLHGRFHGQPPRPATAARRRPPDCDAPLRSRRKPPRTAGRRVSGCQRQRHGHPAHVARRPGVRRRGGPARPGAERAEKVHRQPAGPAQLHPEQSVVSAPGPPPRPCLASPKPWP